jgi:hypothetical protein
VPLVAKQQELICLLCQASERQHCKAAQGERVIREIKTGLEQRPKEVKEQPF